MKGECTVDKLNSLSISSGQRCLYYMHVHIAVGEERERVVSFPRSSWVEVEVYYILKTFLTIAEHS